LKVEFIKANEMANGDIRTTWRKIEIEMMNVAKRNIEINI